MTIKLAIPKGRINKNIMALLKDAGFEIKIEGKNYRPFIKTKEFSLKLYKPQNIPKLVEFGSQDIGFTGNDLIEEMESDVVEILDLELDPVKIVAAIPEDKNYSDFKKGKIRVVSEYETLSKKYLNKERLDYTFIKAYGATEVFVPEDADMIIDNTSTGKTLSDNKLKIIQEIMYSTTRLVANKEALKDPQKSKEIMNFVTLLKSVLEARKRVLVEANVPKEKLEQLIPKLPCMKSPTVSELYNGDGYAVKIAVKKEEISSLILLLKENGATDILVFNLRKVVP